MMAEGKEEEKESTPQESQTIISPKKTVKFMEKIKDYAKDAEDKKYNDELEFWDLLDVLKDDTGMEVVPYELQPISFDKDPTIKPTRKVCQVDQSVIAEKDAEENTHKQYKISTILDKRVTPQEKIKYQVQWKGYSGKNITQ